MPIFDKPLYEFNGPPRAWVELGDILHYWSDFTIKFEHPEKTLHVEKFSTTSLIFRLSGSNRLYNDCYSVRFLTELYDVDDEKTISLYMLSELEDLFLDLDLDDPNPKNAFNTIVARIVKNSGRIEVIAEWGPRATIIQDNPFEVLINNTIISSSDLDYTWEEDDEYDECDSP